MAAHMTTEHMGLFLRSLLSPVVQQEKSRMLWGCIHSLCLWAVPRSQMFFWGMMVQQGAQLSQLPWSPCCPRQWVVTQSLEAWADPCQASFQLLPYLPKLFKLECHMALLEPFSSRTFWVISISHMTTTPISDLWSPHMLEPDTQISCCISRISTWVSNRHLQCNIAKLDPIPSLVLLIPPIPSTFNSSILPIGLWLGFELGVLADSPCPWTPTSRPSTSPDVFPPRHNPPCPSPLSSSLPPSIRPPLSSAWSIAITS